MSLKSGSSSSLLDCRVWLLTYRKMRHSNSCLEKGPSKKNIRHQSWEWQCTSKIICNTKLSVRWWRQVARLSFPLWMIGWIGMNNKLGKCDNVSGLKLRSKGGHSRKGQYLILGWGAKSGTKTKATPWNSCQMTDFRKGESVSARNLLPSPVHWSTSPVRPSIIARKSPAIPQPYSQAPVIPQCICHQIMTPTDIQRTTLILGRRSPMSCDITCLGTCY